MFTLIEARAPYSMVGGREVVSSVYLDRSQGSIQYGGWQRGGKDKS